MRDNHGRIGTEIQARIVRRSDGTFDLMVNLGASVISTLTSDEFDNLLHCLTEMRKGNPDQYVIYYFPAMRIDRKY
jgi:hypothetical protein